MKDQKLGNLFRYLIFSTISKQKKNNGSSIINYCSVLCLRHILKAPQKKVNKPNGGNLTKLNKIKLKELDTKKTILLKKANELAKIKKMLYSDIDIETPMSDEERKLNKDIANKLKEEFENSTGNNYPIVLWKNIVGYYSGYDFENNCSIYCGTMSEKTSIEQINEYKNE